MVKFVQFGDLAYNVDRIVKIDFSIGCVDIWFDKVRNPIPDISLRGSRAGSFARWWESTADVYNVTWRRAEAL